MYRLFTNDAHVKKPNTPISKIERARNGKQDAKLRPFAKALSRMNDKDHKLLLHMASKITKRAKATMNCFSIADLGTERSADFLTCPAHVEFAAGETDRYV